MRAQAIGHSSDERPAQQTAGFVFQKYLETKVTGLQELTKPESYSLSPAGLRKKTHTHTSRHVSLHRAVIEMFHFQEIPHRVVSTVRVREGRND